MTEDEFTQLPDDGRRYELVDGAPKELPVSVLQGAIAANIVFKLEPHARGKGVLADGKAGFRMAGGNIRCPDISYTRKERLPGGKPNEGFGDAAPDFCIEILATNENMKDAEHKLNEYFEAGSSRVWWLFPIDQSVDVYKSPDDYVTLGPDDEIDAGDLLPEFRCLVKDLFDTGLE